MQQWISLNFQIKLTQVIIMLITGSHKGGFNLSIFQDLSISIVHAIFSFQVSSYLSWLYDFNGTHWTQKWSFMVRETLSAITAWLQTKSWYIHMWLSEDQTLPSFTIQILNFLLYCFKIVCMLTGLIWGDGWWLSRASLKGFTFIIWPYKPMMLSQVKLYCVKIVCLYVGL